MNLAVIVKPPSNPSIKLIIEKAIARGHQVTEFNPRESSLLVDPSNYQILWRDRPFKIPDLVLPWIGNNLSPFDQACLYQFELLNVPLANSAGSLDKYRSILIRYQLMAKNGVPMPATMIAARKEDLPKCIEAVNGPPVILRLLYGSRSMGIIIADSVQSAQSTLDGIWRTGRKLMVQRSYSKPLDLSLRALLVGGEIVTAWRLGHNGLHASPMKHSISSQDIELTDVQKDICLKVQSAFSLGIVGVDLISNESETMVTDINPAPDFSNLEDGVRDFLVGKIIDYLEATAKTNS